VDIDPALLKIVERGAKEAAISNIVTVLAAADDSKLPEPVDLIFICDTLHHIPNQAVYLRNLRGHLKPGGQMVVIDFSERWPEGHESMRYTLEQLDGWLRDAGLSRVRALDWLDNSFFVFYR
jgi:ubiquinone/menaquinone biosynthesis C-methylase UbiE